MMARRVKRGADERKTSFYVPRSLLRAANLRAMQDEVPLRHVFIAALTAYLATKPPKGGSTR